MSWWSWPTTWRSSTARRRCSCRRPTWSWASRWTRRGRFRWKSEYTAVAHIHIVFIAPDIDFVIRSLPHPQTLLLVSRHTLTKCSANTSCVETIGGDVWKKCNGAVSLFPLSPPLPTMTEKGARSTKVYKKCSTSAINYLLLFLIRKLFAIKFMCLLPWRNCRWTYFRAGLGLALNFAVTLALK